MLLPDTLRYRVPLFSLCHENGIRKPFPAQAVVGGHCNHRQTVYGPEFPVHLAGGSRHPRQVEITPEKPLVTDPCLGLRLLRDIAALFYFDELLQPAFIGTVRHHPAGEFINNLNLAIQHQVLFIPAEQRVGRQGQSDRLIPTHLPGPQKAHLLCVRLDPDASVVGEVNLSFTPVHTVMDAFLEGSGQRHRLFQKCALITCLCGPGYDQGCSGFINQYAVRLIHYGEMKTPKQHSIRPRPGRPVQVLGLQPQ